MRLLIVRFVVFAAICCIILLWWAERRGGHAAIGIVAGGIMTSWAAGAAWIAAALGEHLATPPFLRLAIHVVAAFAVFVLISFGIFMFLYPDTHDYGDFILQLGAIVAFAAAVDGVMGWRSNEPASSQ